VNPSENDFTVAARDSPFLATRQSRYGRSPETEARIMTNFIPFSSA
jgi:hypothetical protein